MLPRTTIALFIALLAALTLAGWQRGRAESYRADLAHAYRVFADERTALAQAQTQAVAKARADEAVTTRKIQETLDVEIKRRSSVETALRRSDAAGRGLRDELAETQRAYSALAASASASPSECRAAATTASMCAGLLDQCSASRREIAGFAEASSGALAVCVGTYRALTPPRIEPP